MTRVGIVFNNEALLSACREQPIVLETAWAVCGFSSDPFGQQLNYLIYLVNKLVNLLVVLEVSFGDKRYQLPSVSPLLGILFRFSLYWYMFRFHWEL